MVKFLSIIFFSWISSNFVGVFKSSRFFCVTLYMNHSCCQITLGSETFSHNRQRCEVLTGYSSLERWPPGRIRDFGQNVLLSSF